MINKQSDTDELLSLIREVHIRMSSYYSRVISKEKLSVQHYTLLFMLLKEGKMQMNEIARNLAVTSPAVTNIVYTLEKEKMIQRIPNENDRRVTFIAITDHGKIWVDNIQKKTMSAFYTTFSELDDSERDHIKNFYQSFIINFDKVVKHENK